MSWKSIFDKNCVWLWGIDSSYPVRTQKWQGMVGTPNKGWCPISKLWTILCLGSPAFPLVTYSLLHDDWIKRVSMSNGNLLSLSPNPHLPYGHPFHKNHHNSVDLGVLFYLNHCIVYTLLTGREKMDIFSLKIFSLFLEKRREKEKERNIVQLPFSSLNLGPGLQPRYVPWLGIELAAFWFADWRSIHWAIPARAR